MAKLTESAPDNRSQLPTVVSEPGLVLGTVGYMSPEQVRGQTVDHRTDIFAFGAILHEMLSGVRAFQRDSAADTMSAILKEEPPDLATDGANVPAGLERVIRRCLEKEPERRFRSASDLGFALETLTTPSGSGRATSTPAPRPFRWPLVSRVVTFAALAAALAMALTLSFRKPTEPSTPAWSGSVLVGGSTIAFGPRVSPDGQTVAFRAMVNGLTQLAVLQVNSGDWEVRTSNRSNGPMQSFPSWSRDGSKIFFDRAAECGRVYSVPAVGGEERLVLEDAFIADTLPDDSLLVNRCVSGRFQLYRFWPNTAKSEEALPVFPVYTSQPVRATATGDQIVFYGYLSLDDAVALGRPHLYRFDLQTSQTVRVAPSLELRGIAEYTALNEFAFAVSPDGETVFIDVASGDLHRVVAAPADGASSLRTLLTVTGRPFSFDAAKDGSLYIDQVDTSLAVMRVRDKNVSAFPESLVKSTIPPEYCSAVLPLSDGGVLYPAQLSGRRRLFVASPGKEPKAFTDAAIEESSPPIARVGVDTIGFLLGTAPKQVIALASAADGRLQRRIEIPQGAQISCMAGSPDGKTIYYISNSTLWMIPSAGGEAHKLTAADAVALHPRTGEIVLQRNAAAGVRYFRYDAGSGREQQIEIRSAEARPGIGPLSSSAIAADGRMVFPINVPDLWAWSVGLFDPVSQSIKRVPMLAPSGGLNSVAWTDDGQIIFAGVTWQSSIWRFRPLAEPYQNR